MPVVTGPDKDGAEAALFRAISDHCGVAFYFDCRLAVRVSGSGDHRFGYFYSYEFIVLAPGEFPPSNAGWTLYEDRSGRAVGRSA